MSKNGDPAKGYYSILQYVPDLERAEGANIGIVLFCPEKGFLKVQTATSNDRVRRFFGPDESRDLDLDRINAFKAAFEERVAAEAGRIGTLEEFRHFINTRANQLLLTDPRPVKVFDAEVDVARLFDALVGGRRRRTQRRAQSTKEEMIQQFSDLLLQRRIIDRVQREIRIESQLLDRTLVFPFAFQNGRLNVIDPVAFEATKERNIDRACQLAVEGNELLQLPQPVSLNVLGSFDQADGIEQVRALLQKFQVRLYTADDLDSLIEEIERAH
ncbi:MAG: DUF3037 domain-containing protein [Acidobacteriota bacterium]